MIIRRLRQDEHAKLKALHSQAYTFSFNPHEDEEELNEEVYGAFLDNDETLTATICVPEYDSYWDGQIYKSLGIGGVASLPEYRRMGAVRAIFEELFRMAPERGWVTSFLYPFSFAYYRQFGYERIMRNVSVQVPCSALSHIERNTAAKLYVKGGTVNEDDLVSIYEEYARQFNVMFRRQDAGAYSDNPHHSQKYTYVWYDSKGQAGSLATFRISEDDVLETEELCYKTPEALRGILGFLRMYEGQVSAFAFKNLPYENELEWMIGEYVDTDYSVENGAMGRVLLPGVLLENHTYPEEPGSFRLRVDDPLPYNHAVYEVTYGHGEAKVNKLAWDESYDLAMGVPALSRVLLGDEHVNAKRAVYLDGVTLVDEDRANDFFRAFPGHPVSLHEHF